MRTDCTIKLYLFAISSYIISQIWEFPIYLLQENGPNYFIKEENSIYYLEQQGYREISVILTYSIVFYHLRISSGFKKYRNLNIGKNIDFAVDETLIKRKKNYATDLLNDLRKVTQLSIQSFLIYKTINIFLQVLRYGKCLV